MLLIIGVLSSIFPATLHAQGVQVSGGLDARYTPENHMSADDLRLEGVFLNLRKVWADRLGDRWIAIAQADFDDNFKDIRPYQIYVQYKGPLGKWNVRTGHFLLPFGLLATYDTERLVLQGLEKISLGIRKDTGAEVFGHFGTWDYAVSGTDGLSDIHFLDSRASPLLVARLAYVRENWQVGFSTLIGRVLLDPDFEIEDGAVSERRLALDATGSFGPFTLRAEGTLGTDDGHPVGGGLLLADYAITPNLELNARYAGWHKGSDRQLAGVGLTYQLRRGLTLRLANNSNLQGKKTNAFTVQGYYEFSRQF